MKPAPFAYEAPASLDEALRLLASRPDDAKVIAGGQSLVPMMNFRLARPGLLVDVNGLAELAYLRRRDGRLRIGALTRHATIERSRIVADGWPLLRAAAAHVAHAQIRNRGTVGGSVVHADSAAELPVALAALDAVMHVRSARGARTIGWRDFFLTHLTTAMEPDEILTEIEVPPPPPGTGVAFTEFSRRSGDFALAGSAVTVTRDPDGVCTAAAIAPLAAAPTPIRIAAAERALVGKRVDAEHAAAAAELVAAAIKPTGDGHGSTEFRRRLSRELTRRAILAASAGRDREEAGDE